MRRPLDHLCHVSIFPQRPCLWKLDIKQTDSTAEDLLSKIPVAIHNPVQVKVFKIPRPNQLRPLSTIEFVRVDCPSYQSFDPRLERSRPFEERHWLR